MNKIEIFSAGCPFCEEAVEKIKKQACSDCEVTILNIFDEENLSYAKKMGVKRLPAMTTNQQLSPCCRCDDLELKL
ncbi:MAG: hypothetical protein K940chlam3_01681 [Chlamydiae bacterium]|nr:hypothetical protein [Chlamydiota bacterium]